ncbi:MAG: hypothetical protein A4S15_02455 [Candidatus Raskinella chloraquaticus]|uniref:Ammonia monooxygenase n=2 Tax=Candidatus Raskinella chloraquaticus TaxID=1951219 RepID=A0A1W9HQS6_9HYPH|nr:MAG: hypothetical protein A4S15_02455 [Proteobacteria bacterium SG_bin8]
MPLKPSLPSRSEIMRTLATLALATLGGTAFAAVGLPAAWLSGAMVGATCGLIFGLRLHVPNALRDLTMLVLGVSMGVSVTPATLHAMARWPASLAILGATVVAIICAAIIVSRTFGWDRNTAMYASAPGALSTVLILAEESGADMRRVVIAQTIRLFLLVAVLPFVLALIDPHTIGTGLRAQGQANTALLDYILLFVAGVAGAALARLLRIPAPILIGAAIASSLVHGLDLIEAPVPLAIQLPAFVILGAYMGLRFHGTTFAMLRAEIAASALIFLSSTIVALAGAFLVHWLLAIPLTETMVAFAPGGIEAMTIIAFSLGLDVAYVGTHHLLRFLALALTLPIVSTVLRRINDRQ